MMLQERASRIDEEQAAEATTETGTDPAVLAAGVSVLLSWYFFYAKDNQTMGLFVGLWPPTILAFASYFKQTRMSDKLESSIGSKSLSQYLP